MAKRILNHLTEEQKDWFEEHYPSMSNARLAKVFGVTTNSIYAYAHKRGWHKSPEHMKEINHDRMVAVNAMRKARGDVFCKPGTLAANAARRGKTWEETYGVEQAAQMRAKSRQAQRDLKNSEWTRRMCGLPPLTRKNFCGKSGKTRHIAGHLRALGYRTDYKTMTAYYSPTTQRSEYYETGRRGRGIPFRFKPEPIEGTEKECEGFIII